MKPALASLALAALCAAGTAGAAQPIGRLFFTPAERAQLDNARAQKRVPQPAAAAQPVDTRPETQVVTYNGIVRRSDGKSILWLNNKPADEKEALSGLAITGRVKADGGVTLQVPGSGSSVDLKVGQRAELQTGKVSESRPEPAKPEAKPDAAAKSDTVKSEPAKAEPAKAEVPAKAGAAPAKSAEAAAKKAEGAPPASREGLSSAELEQQRARAR
ncbi:MAG: hypothetical protein JWM26_1894 [Betaproteobacteria bacterium]|nr:hypothetical protein [Betaproteobacteria bacterium]